MASKADRKWAHLRTLFEHHKVGFDILVDLADVKLPTVMKHVRDEGWVRLDTTEALRAKMLSAFSDELERFKLADCNDPIEEKRARCLQMMAKSLESLAVAEGKLGERQEKTTGSKQEQDRNAELDDYDKLDDGRIDKINRDLERLVSKMESRKSRRDP